MWLTVGKASVCRRLGHDGRRQEHRQDAVAEVQAGAYQAVSIEEGIVMGWEVLNGSLPNPYVLDSVIGRGVGICALG